MKLTVEMSLNNAAYREYAPYPEEGQLVPENVAQSLKEVATKIEMGYTNGNIIDYNGNKVGTWKIE